MTIRAVAVLGAGQMGCGIAHSCALAGLHTTLYDQQADLLPQAQKTIHANLARQLKKGSIEQAQLDKAVSHLQLQTALGDWLSGADFIIEAISENLPAKQMLYRQIAAYQAEDAVLASNTSSYSISELAAAAKNASRFIGMHFMNPAPLMPLVEIISGAHTSAHSYRQTAALADMLGKQTIRAKDSPGFITNRVLFALLNEAAFALFENVGGVEAIDRAMTLGMQHPMGPLTLADFIGLDTCWEILKVLHRGLGKERFQPCPLFEQLVKAGCLGRKSGCGFYDYSVSPPRPAKLFNR